MFNKKVIQKDLFDTYNGNEIYKYTLKDEIEVSIITLGARITDIIVPDKNGRFIDVALNMTNAKDIIEKSAYMGATIGRSSNRIGGGSFMINGKVYNVWHDENAAHLHGGKVGFDKKIFAAETDEKSNSITMQYFSPDGEEGYPGDLNLSVKFTVRGAKLIIEYFAKTSADTLLGVTNHTYFNLNGENDGSVLDNVLQLNADEYLPTDKILLPTGEKKSVDGTPFDFRRPKPIGKDLGVKNEDLIKAGGFDHNFCLKGKHFATVYSDKTGIQMDCYTDMPGVQFYSGNFLSGESGKSVYNKNAGFCLETQFYPDAIHNPEWKCPILKKGEDFYSKTEYVFAIKK